MVEIDLSSMNNFKDKITKEFGLTERLDSNGCSGMYYNDFLVLKLLPRKNCWYGVWREVPEDGNKWRTFRVTNPDEENIHYEHIRQFVKTNSE